MDLKQNANSNEYLKTRVMTASPEQLQLMLYDGAIRFCEQARIAIDDSHFEKSFKLLTKAENIIMEMCLSMREEIDPDTCNKMRSLYFFCYEQLVTANMKREVSYLDEALKILRHMRETWILLIEKIQQDRESPLTEYQNSSINFEPDSQLSSPQDQPVGSTISLEGWN